MIEPAPALLAAGRIVVVSPHLDDAVMSVGATIARSVRAGATVEILTVFAYKPSSDAPAGPWDRKSGFKTEAEAARVRRLEDDRACRILGASPRRFDFGAEPYERGTTPEEIRSTVAAAVEGAQCVLIPGFPLVHPDHAELAQLLLSANLSPRVGLYAEQPYLFYERKAPQRPMLAPAIESLLKGPPVWTRTPMGRAERRLKVRAIRSYQTQLRGLGLSHIFLYGMLWHEVSQGGEPIAWLT